jgi:hypothetical protein
MARGWESKSVEQQQEEAGRARRGGGARVLTPEQRDRQQAREQLRLALARTQADLQAACQPAHRDMLRLRLEAIEAELAALVSDG